MTQRFVVIAGGGTAGHVHPGLSVARALVAKGHDVDSILYVGTERGVEQILVPEAGFELRTVTGRGIPRRVSMAAIRAGASLLWGSIQAFGLLGRERPRVVLSLGGYAAVPCAVAARLRRIPVVVHEQNAVPGAANRLISKWATAAAVSFRDTPLPRAVLTGNPVRQEMIEARSVGRDAARAALDMDTDVFLVVVTGGSLGALQLNEAAIAAAKVWRNRDDVLLRHVIGRRDWDSFSGPRRELAGSDGYQPVEYETEMPTVFAAADLVVSRAGASTIAELAVAGVPSILVPLPGAPGDHQTANARALVDAGGAQLIVNADLDGHALVDAVQALLADRQHLGQMRAAAASVGVVDAAQNVASLLEEHAA